MNKKSWILFFIYLFIVCNVVMVVVFLLIYVLVRIYLLLIYDLPLELVWVYVLKYTKAASFIGGLIAIGCWWIYYQSYKKHKLAGYLRVYASEMDREYGSAVSQELVRGLLSGQDYIQRNPDSEAMVSAQKIINTWGYHQSNASIGDPALLFGSSVLGTTIKEGMALNTVIGVGVNSAAQLSGNDPFSYVDAIMAGVTAAATTGKGILPSAGINMGGAAIGSGIKGEDPTNSVISAGFGSAAGSVGGKVVDALSPVTDQVKKDVISAVAGSAALELTGSAVKGELDQRDKAQ